MRSVIAEALHDAAPDADPAAEILVAAAVQGAAEAVARAWATRRNEITEAEALDLLTSFCWGGLSSLIAGTAARAAVKPA